MAVEIEESTIAQVKSFIEEKRKKKEPSRKDADEFEQLWLAAVEENDLDKETFALLCDGFRYAGARPLFKHFKMKNTSKLPYATLGTYEPIRKNRVCKITGWKLLNYWLIVRCVDQQFSTRNFTNEV